MPRRTALLALLALTAACGGKDDARETAIVRDSAGVTVVESSAARWKEGAGWRLAAEPKVAIGSEEGAPEEQFGFVSDALRMADGSLLVADGQSQDLRVYDAAGRYLRTVGRKGGGPGEYQGLHALVPLRGDSIGAIDVYGMRLSVLAPDGRHVRSVRVRPDDEWAVPSVAGVFPDGSPLVAVEHSRRFRNSETMKRDTARLLRYTAEGAPRDTIAWYAGLQTLTITGPNMAMRSPVAFGALTARGFHGDAVYVADNARAEVRVLGPDGGLRRLFRWAHSPEPVSDEEKAIYRERQLAGAEASLRPAVERMLAEMPWPKRKGAFESLTVDAGGNVWIRAYRSGREETVRWTVFDPEGRLLGELRMPEALRVTEIGPDYVLGVHRDEADVQQVRLYPLERPGA